MCIEKSAVNHSRYVNLSSLLECVIKYFKNEGPKPKGIGILSSVHHPRRPRGSQSGAGEMARRKFSRTGGRTPGYQVSPDHFQTALRIPAPDWAEKNPLYYSAQSGAGIRKAVWKWYPGVLPPVLENFRRAISPAPD